MSTLIRNRFRVLLIVSLALNLFLGGLFAGHWLEAWRRGPEPFQGRPPPLRLHMGRMLERLPAEAREQATRVMERRREAMRKTVRAMHQARREVRRSLHAEPFDPARVERALEALRTRSSAAQAEMHAAMAELARELPPDARRALADGLGRPGRHRRPRPPDR